MRLKPGRDALGDLSTAALGHGACRSRLAVGCLRSAREENRSIVRRQTLLLSNGEAEEKTGSSRRCREALIGVAFRDSVARTVPQRRCSENDPKTPTDQETGRLGLAGSAGGGGRG